MEGTRRTPAPSTPFAIEGQSILGVVKGRGDPAAADEACNASTKICQEIESRPKKVTKKRRVRSCIRPIRYWHF